MRVDLNEAAQTSSLRGKIMKKHFKKEAYQEKSQRSSRRENLVKKLESEPCEGRPRRSNLRKNLTRKDLKEETGGRILWRKILRRSCRRNIVRKDLKEAEESRILWGKTLKKQLKEEHCEGRPQRSSRRKKVERKRSRSSFPFDQIDSDFLPEALSIRAAFTMSALLNS